MLPFHIDVDVDGDILAVLVEPSQPFAPWPAAQGISADGIDNERANETHGTTVTVKDEDDMDDNAPSTDTESTHPPTPDPAEFHFRLSSKHILLASPRLRKSSKKPWEASNYNQEDGLQRWDVGDRFDPEAFKIVMNVIHGRNKSIPLVVDLELMAKICVVIQNLQFHEAMALICDIWKPLVGKAVPNKLCRDLVLCVFVACVFGASEIFLRAIRPAIFESQTTLPTLGLPFSPGVLEVVEETRQRLINQILDSLYDVADLLTGPSAPCHVECSSMLLGALLKQMGEIPLPRTRPAHLDPTLSVGSLLRAIRDFKSPTWVRPSEVVPRGFQDFETWKKTRGAGMNRPSSSRRSGSEKNCDGTLIRHPCTLKDRFNTLDYIESTWQVLELPENYRE